jgi:hypothetical protein
MTMQNDYLILDNVIPNTTQQRLFNIATSPTFNWNIRRNSSYTGDSSIPSFWSANDTIGYTNVIYANGEIINDKMMAWCLQILDSSLDKAGVELDELIRIQANLLYRHVSPHYKEGMWTTAHVDQQYNHNVLLYYINDSDGDTVLFNEKRGDEFDHFTELERVKPKAGSAILFDGRYFHSASNPINNNKRLVINFNFTLKDNVDGE